MGPVSSWACTRRPVGVVVAAMVLTITSWSAAAPRQFVVMCENSLYSILFRFDVPGGRWHTVMVMPLPGHR